MFLFVSNCFTAHLAKRAKVLFLQVFVILSLNGGREGRVQQGECHNPPPPPDLLPGHSMHPSTIRRRAVCILLECSLVSKLFKKYSPFYNLNIYSVSNNQNEDSDVHEVSVEIDEAPNIRGLYKPPKRKGEVGKFSLRSSYIFLVG